MRVWPLVLLSLAVLPSPVRACDSAGCLFATRGPGGALEGGGFRIDLSYRNGRETDPLTGTEAVSVARRPWISFADGIVYPGFHDDTTARQDVLQLDVAYGISSQAMVTLSAPLYGSRRDDARHGDVPLQYRTSGIGDLVLGLRYGLIATRPGELVAGIALKLPTGRHDDVSEYDGTIIDPMVQPGSGSWDVLGSLAFSQRVAGVDWTLSGSYQRAGENDLRYRFGDETIGALSASHTLAGDLSGSLQLKVFHKQRSQYLDVEVAGTGGTFGYVVPGLRLAATEGLSLYGFATVPVYRNVNDTQLGPSIGVVLGISRTF